MTLSPQQFEKLLKSQSLVISLIGMSNVGKTFWSEKLSRIGFLHLNCDDLIEAELGPELEKAGYKGIADMAKWLGQPYARQFRRNEKRYLALERKVVKNILRKLAHGVRQNTVIDTTGSIIHTGSSLCLQLKKCSSVIYIEATNQMEEEMFDRYIKEPKPVIWKDIYQQKSPAENHMAALRRCYPMLLKHRSSQYSKYADRTIPYNNIPADIGAEEFLGLVKQSL